MLLLECNTSHHHELNVAGKDHVGTQSSYAEHRYASLSRRAHDFRGLCCAQNRTARTMVQPQTR